MSPTQPVSRWSQTPLQVFLQHKSPEGLSFLYWLGGGALPFYKSILSPQLLDFQFSPCYWKHFSVSIVFSLQFWGPPGNSLTNFETCQQEILLLMRKNKDSPSVSFSLDSEKYYYNTILINSQNSFWWVNEDIDPNYVLFLYSILNGILFHLL